MAPTEHGGLESVVLTLLRGLATRQRHHVAVGVVLDEPWRDREHPFVAALGGAPVAVHPLWLPPRAYRDERRWVRDLCEQLRPDVVHTHGARADVIHGTEARRRAVPTVSTVHGFTGGGAKNRFYEWLQKRSLRRFDAVVPVSRPMARMLIDFGVPKDRVHVLPNAWAAAEDLLDRDAARRALGVPEHGFRVGWVGRFTREKGIDVLLDGLARIDDLAWTASFVGDGRERAALEGQARELGIGSRVTFHGAVPRAHRLYSAFDVLVLCSRTEGTPMVLLEAMSAGVPIVASSVGGIPDMLGDAEAILIPPDDREAVAKALRVVMTDPKAARLRAEKAKERVRAQFAPQPWVAAYEQIYRDAVERAGVER